jgi:hypothetical protein
MSTTVRVHGTQDDMIIYLSVPLALRLITMLVQRSLCLIVVNAMGECQWHTA